MVAEEKLLEWHGTGFSDILVYPETTRTRVCGISPFLSEADTCSPDNPLPALDCRLRRSQKEAPTAASPMTPSGMPTPSPTFAPVLKPAELESSCVLPPDNALSPAGELVAAVCIAVRSCEMVLRYVLEGDVDVDWVLTLLLKLAVAYTTESGALNVKSSMVQHVKFVSACFGQSLRLPPT